MNRWTPDPRFWTGPAPRERHRLTTSTTEVLHLLIAFAVLTVDLVLVERSFWQGGVGPGLLASPKLLGLVVAFAVAAALTGFLFHELAHKVAAQRYGFWAEFRMSPTGLLLSFATALFGFIFAAPGATVVSGMGDVREWGRTSLAGPALNLAEGGAFLAAAFGLWAAGGDLLPWSMLVLLAFINGWFAAFNLLPIGPLDGRKVLRWSRPVWAVGFAAAAVFTVVAFLILGGTPPY